jgi:uncharacterized protein (TIGR03084 family)
MAASIDDVCRDFLGEVASLDAILKPASLDAILKPLRDEQQPDEKWHTPTPAPGWTIADQIAHLAMFDARALWSITDPDRFRTDRDSLMTNRNYLKIHETLANLSPRQLYEQWHQGAQDLYAAALHSDPTARVEWYGPAMSVTSKITARIMETWAHGHDVADALGVPVGFTDRLRHVAHIGVRSRRFAFAANTQDAPEVDPFVELHTPNGEVWSWGAKDSPDQVRGPVLGFCQLVTQRRHLDDTAVVAVGDGAKAWIRIAQSFAGPPGQGRQPNQFA